jgi:hypothetical protein
VTVLGRLVRRAARWAWSLKDYRLVQADDPIGLMFRHPPDDDQREDPP